MFFGPAVVTARALSVQVNMAVNQFLQNFRTAVNPQIVKRLAAEDLDGSKQLLLTSTKFSYYMMLILGLPVILLAKPLLDLWLAEVPDYTVIFLQLIIVQSLFSVFDTSFYTTLYAKGRLRENALISPTLGFIQFPVVYMLFKLGYSPVAMSYVGVLVYAIAGFIIKPILVCKIADYTMQDILSVFIPCVKVTLLAIPIPILLNHYLDYTVLNFFTVCLVSTICVLLSTYYFGISKGIKNKALHYIKIKFGR